MAAIAKTTPEQNKEMLRLVSEEKKPIKDVCKLFGISDQTCRNILKEMEYTPPERVSYKKYYDAILAMHKAGISRTEIARKIGCPPETIDKIITKLLNPPIRGGTITQEQDEQIEEDYISGKHNSTELAKIYGVSSQAMDKRLHKKGIVRLKEIINTQKNKIIEMYGDGKSMPEIAQYLKCSPAGIGRAFERWNISVRNASKCHRIYDINEDFFDVIDTQEKAYFLGFLYADGCNQQEDNRVRIDLHFKDVDILEKLSKLIYVSDSESRIKTQIRKRVYKNVRKFIPHKYLDINSKHICETLNKLGCTPRKSLTLTYPSWMPEHLQNHFIRGYYDGDGGTFVTNIKGRGASTGIIGTSEFLNEIKIIVYKTSGVSLSDYKTKNTKSNVWKYYCGGNRNCQKLLDWLYTDATIFLNRKYAIYQNLTTKNKTTDALIQKGTRGFRLTKNYNKCKFY
jgi:transposase-like protein